MKKKGFTLIELLVVIVLIGVISLITVPIVSNIIENSKKEAFKRSIEGLGREYEYKEVQTNTTLGEIDACSLQETCKIEGTIKRDSLGNVSVYVTNGNYCTNGIIGSLIVVNGTCGVGTGIDEITFAVTNHEISYSKDTQVIDITPIGGSGDFTYTKVSEKNSSNVDTNYITVNDGILQVSPSIVKGNYTVRVRIKDNETKVEKEVNIVITIDEVSISNIELADIASIDYDGTAQKPNIVVVSNGSILEENIDYEVIYENNINAGEATVIIRGIGNYTGEITKTFTINRVEAPNTSVVAASLDYNGLNQSLISSVNVSNSHVYYSVDTPINSSNYLSIGSETKPTRSEAGIYVVYYYAPADNYNEVSGSVTVTINPIVINIPPQPNDKNYTGSSQNSGITCPTGSSASGTQSAINAGSYTQTCTLNNSNYKWNDNTITPKDITWVINFVTLNIPSQPSDKEYTGSSQNSGIICPNGSTASGDTSATYPGTYTQTCTLNNSNYKWNDNSTTSKDITWVIKGVAEVGTCNSLTYNGSSQTLVSGGEHVTYVNNSGTNAGDYTVTVNAETGFRFIDGSTSKTLSCTIKRLKIATPGSCNSLIYNGSSQTLASGGEHVSYVNNSQTIPGSYTVGVNADNNYAFNDGSTSKTLPCSISKLTPTLNLSSTSGVYSQDVTITASGSNYGTLSCSVDNSDGTCSVSGNTILVSPASYPRIVRVKITGSGNDYYDSITVAKLIIYNYDSLDSYIDYSTLRTNPTSRILASSKAVCWITSGNFECFKPNNYEQEKEHMSSLTCYRCSYNANLNNGTFSGYIGGQYGIRLSLYEHPEYATIYSLYASSYWDNDGCGITVDNQSYCGSYGWRVYPDGMMNYYSNCSSSSEDCG